MSLVTHDFSWEEHAYALLQRYYPAGETCTPPALLHSRKHTRSPPLQRRLCWTRSSD